MAKAGECEELAGKLLDEEADMNYMNLRRQNLNSSDM
jgi:hypothetical protein